MRTLERVPYRPLLDVMIPGFYAWVVTVAVPLGGDSVSGWAYLFGILALLALVASGLLAMSRERLWSAVPVALFVTASALVWLFIGPEVTTLGWIGAVGWAAFAIGWVRACGTRPESRSREATLLRLAPRKKLPKTVWVSLVAGLICALVPWLFAWTVQGRERSLLAHGLALLGALQLLAAASELSATVGPKADSVRFLWLELIRTLAYGGLMALGCWLTFS